MDTTSSTCRGWLWPKKWSGKDGTLPRYKSYVYVDWGRLALNCLKFSELWRFNFQTLTWYKTLVELLPSSRGAIVFFCMDILGIWHVLPVVTLRAQHLSWFPCFSEQNTTPFNNWAYSGWSSGVHLGNCDSRKSTLRKWRLREHRGPNCNLWRQGESSGVNGDIFHQFWGPQTEAIWV